MARTKAGTSKQSAAQRRKRFVEAYISNGQNATQAAITAGYSKNGAGVIGTRLLKDTSVSQDIAARAEHLAAIVGLDTTRTLREVARLSYLDPRAFYWPDGTLKPIAQWTDDMAATVASLEVLEEFAGSGEDRQVSGHVKKIKFWDKNTALDKAMRHAGLYERDNAQTQPNLSLRINIVGGPPREAEPIDVTPSEPSDQPRRMD